MNIFIDYDKAIAQAKQLEQAASKCKDSLAGLKRERGGSEVFWIGASGNAMREQMEKAERELSATEKQLNEAAASIRRVVEEMRRKDMDLSRVIRGGRL